MRKYVVWEMDETWFKTKKNFHGVYDTLDEANSVATHVWTMHGTEFGRDLNIQVFSADSNDCLLDEDQNIDWETARLIRPELDGFNTHSIGVFWED
ncbi:hypothetical protein M2140_000103 [Clostridiales Family XIII bacterium PM5-7]